jgi:hypothetical protein
LIVFARGGNGRSISSASLGIKLRLYNGERARKQQAVERASRQGCRRYGMRKSGSKAAALQSRKH